MGSMREMMCDVCVDDPISNGSNTIIRTVADSPVLSSSVRTKRSNSSCKIIQLFAQKKIAECNWLSYTFIVDLN